MQFANIRFVLVNTSHPGNIGSAARAMKTMGFDQLYLVNPKLFPHDKARELASYAVDVLQKARVVSSLEEAISDCSLVLGTSARFRTIPWPQLSVREMAEKAVQESESHTVAILFGSEQTGLTNEELHKCHYHVHIPTNPDYTSLNIAAAIQIIAYELRMSGVEAKKDFEPVKWDYRSATSEELEGFYEHLEKTLIEIEFLNPQTPRQLMSRFRRLFTRARPDMMEINILRGMLTAVGKK